MSTLQWQDSQIKSFTRWINGYVDKRGLTVENLGEDMKDGVILINLLEILTGKTIERYYKAPKSRTYMIANHTIALAFMGQQKLGSNCSAQDLVDGRITMLLGLIWSLIRHFSFKAAGKHLLSKTQLIAWCKSVVGKYNNINIDGSLQNFQDGLVFCALIHKYDPMLLDYDSLNPKNIVANFKMAISIADNQLGMPKLLDPADIDTNFKIDERSLLTYLAEFYNMFQRKAEFASKPSTPRNEPPPTVVKDIDPNLDIIAVAEKYASMKKELPPATQIELMRAEIEQLHIQIMHLTEEYETRLVEKREEADREIQIREEKIEYLEKKIEEFARQQGSPFLDFDHHAQWTFINEQRKTINWERKKLEQEKLKLAQDQDMLQKAQIAIQKQQDEITIQKQKEESSVEREKMGNRRAMLMEDMKVIDSQGHQVNDLINVMKDELRVAKIAIEKLKEDEFAVEYLVGETLDELEGMRYYNEEWWDAQRLLMHTEDAQRLHNVILVQTHVRRMLAQFQRNNLARVAHATIVVTRALKRWRQKRLHKILKKYEPYTREIILVQSVARRWSTRRMCKVFARRTKVAHEILESEKTYVGRLEVVVKVFIEPLRVADLISKEQTRAIFSELEVILGYNNLLLGNLETRMKRWNVHTKLGDIFKRMTDFLKAYTQYVNNYNSAITTISAVKHVDKVANFLSKCHKDGRLLGQDLSFFLILPIQRIPRYVMLLQELVQNTKATHSDYEDLRISLWKMKRVADYINDKKRDAENIHEVLLVQDKLSGKFDNDLVLAQPHRRYLREGFLTDVDEKKKIYYFLFNDLLMGTKKKKHKKATASHSFKYLHRIPLGVATIKYSANASKTPNFKITTSEFAKHTFAGATPEETKSWFLDIESAISKLSVALRARNHTSPEVLNATQHNLNSLDMPGNRMSLQLLPQL